MISIASSCPWLKENQVTDLQDLLLEGKRDEFLQELSRNQNPPSMEDLLCFSERTLHQLKKARDLEQMYKEKANHCWMARAQAQAQDWPKRQCTHLRRSLKNLKDFEQSEGYAKVYYNHLKENFDRHCSRAW